MKSILIVTEQFTLGGLETHIQGEIRQLDEQGIKAHFACGNLFDSSFLPSSICTVHSGIPFTFSASAGDLITAINKIRTIIREQEIEALHIHPFACIIPAVAAAELEGVPYAITLHGPVSLESYGPIYDLLFKEIILSHAPLLIAVSPEVKTLLLPHSAPNTVAYIPNTVSFVETQVIEPPKHNDIDPRWLMVSRLDVAKIQGILDFCIKAKNVGIPGVLIVGDGPAKEDLIQALVNRKLSDFVELTGASTDVFALMRKSSGIAGMGRVVLEGIAAKKVTVLVGYDGVKGIVNAQLFQLATKNNFSGRGMPTLDLASFSEQINSKLSSEDVYDIYLMAKENFCEHNSWRNFFQLLSAVPHGKISLISALYHSLNEISVHEKIPYLQSWVVMERLASLAYSKNHYDSRLFAAIKLQRQRFETVQNNQVLSELNEQIASLNQTLDERDRLIASLNQAITERERQISSQNQAATENDAQVAYLNQAVSDRDGQITDLNEGILKCNVQIDSLNHSQLESRAVINRLNEYIQDSEQMLKKIQNSISWKITLPLRLAASYIGYNPLETDRRALIDFVYYVYRNLPIPTRVRMAITKIRNIPKRKNKIIPTIPRAYSSGNPYSLITQLKPIEFISIDSEHQTTNKTAPFSCVTTVFNEASGISRFLYSIEKQDLLPNELIIVDGGSTDNTINIINTLAPKYPCKLILLSPGRINIAKGRNIGAEHASNEIIAFVDAGCELEQGYFRNLIVPFSQLPNLDLVCGIYKPTNETPSAIRFVPDWSNSQVTDWFLPSGRSVAVKKDLLKKCNGYPEYLTLTGEDTLFDVNYRRLSERWLLSKKAVVRWDTPLTAEFSDKLAYRYGLGDGESGFGDFANYHKMNEFQKDTVFKSRDPSFSGYVEGRNRRAEIEVNRRNIKGLILILAGVPFTDSGGGQRCSQLAMAFARENFKVVYVNIYPSFEEPKKIFFNIDYSLFEFYGLDDFSIADLIDRYKNFTSISITTIIEFPHPHLLPIVNYLKSDIKIKSKIIYDYIDNWRSTLGWDWYTEETESSFIDLSDHLIASAKTLQEDLINRSGRSVLLVPNAVNDNLFNPNCSYKIPEDLPTGRKIVLYVGALWGEWFDWQLLAKCSDEIVDTDFVLIGGVDAERAKEFIKLRKNVHFLGLKDQSALPSYLAHASICHIPFKVDHITHYVNPLKVYEYLAMRKHVIVTPMAEVRNLPNVLVAESTEDYVMRLKNFLINGSDNLDVITTDQFIMKNNWSSRVAQIVHIGK